MSTPRKTSTALFVAALILLSINFRAAIVALAPIMTLVQGEIDTTSSVMGLIATLPVLAFALASPFAAKLAKRYGIENTIVLGLLLTFVGTIFRSLFANPYTIMVGTFTLSCGIAFGAVVLAAAIRRDQPNRIGRMSSLQMFSFSIMAATAAAVSVPLTDAIGWQWSLASWSLLTLPAVFFWLRIKSYHESSDSVDESHSDINILRSKLAWLISLYVGLQSFIFFSFLSWLPAIVVSRGYTNEEASLYLTLFQLIALPTVIVITPLVEKFPHIDKLLSAGSVIILIGVAGVFYGPLSLIWLFSALTGIGSCATFTFCLMLFSMRGENAGQSAALSGMAQTVGFFLASFGPVLAGYLLQVTGGWGTAINIFIAVAIVLIFLGYAAGRPGKL